MTLNGLAKLMEECGELTQVAAKKAACMGTDEHWDGAGSLKMRMEDEIADVEAACRLVAKTFELDEERMAKRANEKLALFLKWHADRKA